jgi:hypothetical protein
MCLVYCRIVGVDQGRRHKMLRLVGWMGAGMAAVIWSLICVALFLVVSLVEGVFEGAAAIASVPLGGMDFGIGWLSDLLGDLGQIAMILLWLGGMVSIWFIKRLITRRDARAEAVTYARPVLQGPAPPVAPAPIADGPQARAAALVASQLRRAANRPKRSTP